MEDQTQQDQSVPWTARDIWLASGLFTLWLLAAVGFSILSYQRNWEVNIGLVVTFWELVLLVPAWWFSVRKYRVPWKTLGLRDFRGEALGIGCGLMIASYGFNLFYTLLLSVFNLQSQLDYAALFKELSSPWLLFLGGVVVAPVVEEIVFRGFVFSGLRQRYTPKKAGVISAGLFAVVHFQPVNLIPILILGLIFAYLYHRSGSIWPAVIMHVMTNLFGLGAAYLASQLDLPVG